VKPATAVRAGLVAGLLALGLAPALAQTAPAASPEAAAMLARMQAIPMARAVEAAEAYTPAETVAGGKSKALRTASARSARIAPDALAAAQAYADAQDSFALIVARNGKVIHEHYAPGFTPASRYATASMHKAVLALAYGPALASGKIALADPLKKHLPEFAGDPKGDVTIEQLLRMTAGLGAPPAKPGDLSAPSTQLMFAPDIRAATRGFTLVHTPGTTFAYANISTQLAGLALEAATGVRYSTWLSQHLWAPIGAADAALWLDRPGGNPHYFCCLQASARDWLRVGELIRNNGKAGGKQAIPAAWVASVIAPSPLNPNFGMNIWRGSPHAPVRRYGPAVAMTVPAAKPFLRDDVVYIDGAGGQRVYVVPSAGLTIVRIGKPAIGWDESELVNRVLAGLKS